MPFIAEEDIELFQEFRKLKNQTTGKIDRFEKITLHIEDKTTQELIEHYHDRQNALRLTISELSLATAELKKEMWKRIHAEFPEHFKGEDYIKDPSEQHWESENKNYNVRTNNITYIRTYYTEEPSASDTLDNLDEEIEDLNKRLDKLEE